MALIVVVRKKLRVPVKGTMKDENGKPAPFDFTLVCDRLTQTEIEEAIGDKAETVKEFVKRVTTDWEDVRAESKELIPFSVDSLASVLDMAGMPVVCYQSYLKEVGAIAKN